MSRFNNFLFIEATDRSKISSDQKRFIFAVSLSFLANNHFVEGKYLYFHNYCYYVLNLEPRSLLRTTGHNLEMYNNPKFYSSIDC